MEPNFRIGVLHREIPILRGAMVGQGTYGYEDGARLSRLGSWPTGSSQKRLASMSAGNG